jgi:hypothetical protein
MTDFLWYSIELELSVLLRWLKYTDARYGTLCAALRRMVWVEMIHLRTTVGQIEDATSLLHTAVLQATEEKDLLQSRIYHSASFTTDLALNLVWDSDSVREEGSTAGLCIAGVLKNLGLVDHSVWVELKPEHRRSR